MAAVQHGKGGQQSAARSGQVGHRSADRVEHRAGQRQPAPGDRPARRRQPAQHVQDVPRVAVEVLPDPAGDGHLDRSLDVFGQRGHVLGGQAREPDVDRVRAVGHQLPQPVLDHAGLFGRRPIRGPQREHQQHAAGVQAAQRVAQRAQRRLVQPLRVVHDDDQRPHPLRRLHRPQEMAAHVDGRHVRRHPVGPGVWLVAGRHITVELRHQAVGQVRFQRIAGGPPDLRVRLLRAEPPQQRGTADARLALHQHAPRHAGRRRPGTLVQIVQFG